MFKRTELPTTVREPSLTVPRSTVDNLRIVNPQVYTLGRYLKVDVFRLTRRFRTWTSHSAFRGPGAAWMLSTTWISVDAVSSYRDWRQKMRAAVHGLSGARWSKASRAYTTTHRQWIVVYGQRPATVNNDQALNMDTCWRQEVRKRTETYQSAAILSG